MGLYISTMAAKVTCVVLNFNENFFNYKLISWKIRAKKSCSQLDRSQMDIIQLRQNISLQRHNNSLLFCRITLSLLFIIILRDKFLMLMQYDTTQYQNYKVTWEPCYRFFTININVNFELLCKSYLEVRSSLDINHTVNLLIAQTMNLR